MGKPDRVGLLDLAKTQDGGCSCIRRGICQRARPVSCIDVRRHGGVPNDALCGLHGGSFKLDETRCIACGHCVESCALNALVTTPAYERRRAAIQALAAKEKGPAAGHSLCPGCGASVVVNLVLAGVEGPYVVTAATLSGAETAFRALKKKGKMEENVKFIAFGGDGGTYDIGLQSLSVDSPSFLSVLSPCPRGWRSEDVESIGLAREAVDTCYWPLFEVENGRYRLTYRPKRKLPVANWLERQGRFSHLAEQSEQAILDGIQQWVDEEWDFPLSTCGEPLESEWRTRETRSTEDYVVHQTPLRTHSFGEPLTASMTSTALEWTRWPALSPAISWGAIEE